MASIRTRKRGSTWYYSFEAGKGLSGSRQRIEKGGYATKDDAFNAGVEAYASYLHNGLPAKDITLNSFYPSFKEHLAESNSPRSVYHIDKQFERHILPMLGDMNVADIKPIHIDSFVRELGKKELSKGTVREILSKVRSMFAYAVYPCELIAINPAANIKIPKGLKDKVVERKVITPEHMNKILSVIPYGHKYHIPIMIAYHTGMRVSEILGLTWDNVKLDEKVILVRKQLLREHHKPCITLTDKLKTETSRRDIPISDKLCSLLKQWKKDRGQYKANNPDTHLQGYLESNNRYRYSSAAMVPANAEKVDLVCTSLEGRYTEVHSFGVILRELDCNSHSFRHTHATMLIEAGASAKGIAARLGHASTQMQDIYTHNTKRLEIDTLKCFESVDNSILSANCRQTEKTENKYTSLSPKVRAFLGV